LGQGGYEQFSDSNVGYPPFLVLVGIKGGILHREGVTFSKLKMLCYKGFRDFVSEESKFKREEI